jgi:hypothetical protein
MAGAAFWTLRTLLQPALFSMRHPASIGITFVFAGGAALHGLAAVWAFDVSIVDGAPTIVVSPLFAELADRADLLHVTPGRVDRL